jgi:ABC-type Zn uptake system ZnuABC Zn-binding protein ZnuA/ABC-type Mn2+/Zn2+ transport system permease subunit
MILVIVGSPPMLDALDLPFVQRGLVEVALLSVGAGLVGTWVVLRGLAFFSHAVGTAAFPGLVLAHGLGLPAAPVAFAGALAFAAAVDRLARRDAAGRDSATALALVGALALGVLLASDVFDAASGVETLLFGSLLAIDGGDLALAAGASAAALAVTLGLGPRWVARGFDPTAARSLGGVSTWHDAALLALVALVVTAALSAVGALLATALIVVPAATVRVWTDRLAAWRVGAVALAAAEGLAGTWIAVEANAPPGAAIATLAGAVFAAAALARALRRAGRRPRLRIAASALPRVALAAGALAVAGVLAACGPGEDGGRLRVVATTGHVADWARQVAGSDARVHQILRPGADPHDYEPRPADVRAVAEADVVLANGGAIDAWVDEVAEESGGGARVVELGRAAPARLPGEQGESYDSHWFQDPRNAIAAVRAIGERLAAADRDRAGAHRRRAAAYAARLAALDRAVARCLARLSPRERQLVTDHDAFGYLAARYRLEVVGAVIPSQSTGAQASAGQVASLVRTIRRRRVRAIFPEHALGARLAEAVARQAGASANRRLYGDALGPPGSPGDTYAGMLAANARALAAGLSGGRVTCDLPGGAP